MKKSDNRHFLRMNYVAVAVMVAIAFAAGLLLRGRGHDDHEQRAKGMESTGQDTGRAQTYYCSMHPQVRSPDPDDKCPICFMDLIPLPDDDQDDDESEVPRLRLSRRAAALMDVRTVPVERRAPDVEIRLFGKVDFDESRIYNIPVRTDAYVEELLVGTPWQTVAKGEKLADLYSPVAVTAMRDLLLTVGDAANDAARTRLLRMGVAAEQISQIEKDAVVPRTFRKKSPVDGVVLEISAREGDFLREGANLTRIADLSYLWVNLEGYERDLPWLAVGQAAEIAVAALPGRSFKGTVIFMEPIINRVTRTVRLRVEVENSDGLLKPGMFANATIHATPGSFIRHAAQANDGTSAETEVVPLVIPVSAPLITGRRALVYVRVLGEDRPTFEPRRIILGPRAGDVYIVDEGLQEGELVVVNGQFRIDSELQIRGRPSMMAPEGDKPSAHDDQHGRPDQLAEIKLQTLCPVMGGPINEKFFADVDGYRLYVCCPGCDKTILENPRKYLDKLRADGVTPYKLQTHCPVMGGEINRDFFHDSGGLRIYVCCPGCLDEVRERFSEIVEEQRGKGVVFEAAD